MNIDDFISSTSETMSTDIDNMDVSLNYDNPELMVSIFIDYSDRRVPQMYGISVPYRLYDLFTTFHLPNALLIA